MALFEVALDEPLEHHLKAAAQSQRVDHPKSSDKRSQSISGQPKTTFTTTTPSGTTGATSRKP